MIDFTKIKGLSSAKLTKAELDELANALQKIEDLVAIEVKPNTLTDKQLYEVYKSIGGAKNKYDNRNVLFVNSTFGKIIRHKGVDTKQIVPQLGSIFELSVPIYSEPHEEREGHKNHPNLIGYHNYLGKAKIDGNEYYVRLTVQEEKTLKKDRTPHQLHSTYISDIELYRENPAASFPRLLAWASADGINFDAKLQHFFEKAREAREKVLNSEKTKLKATENQTFS